MSDLTCKSCNFKNINPNDITKKTFVCSFNPPKPFPLMQEVNDKFLGKQVSINIMSLYPSVSDESPACSNFMFNNIESRISKI